MSNLTNSAARLRRILPGAPLLVGTVSSITGTSAAITLPDGIKVQARGTASVGDRVFVRGGLIEGPAPALTLVDIVV